MRSRAPDPDPAWEAVNRVLDNKMTALDRAYADRTRPPPPPSFFAPAPTPPKFQHPRSPYAPSTVPAADEFTRDLMRPPKYGGHSKRDQLGSIAESWGPDPADELRIGLFQQGAEPPSPPLGARR